MTPLEPVRFAVLGPVRAWRGRTELDLGGPQERAFLALLLVRAGQPVAVSEIVDVLWGTSRSSSVRPRQARTGPSTANRTGSSGV
ncbi:hypothetical protein ABZV46_19295, partial [Streptomyces sp. NPDC005209]